MPTLSVSPSTVEPKGAIKISWSGFRDGYWIYVRFLSGPPEFLPPGEEYPVDVFRVGNTASGSLNTIAPWKDGTYTWQAWQEATGLKSNIVTVTVVAPPPPAPEMWMSLILGLAPILFGATIIATAEVTKYAGY